MQSPLESLLVSAIFLKHFLLKNFKGEIIDNINKLLVVVGRLSSIKDKKTYTEIGGHGLSPHVGGVFWVTHHLHGVHLHTNLQNEHAFINRPDSFEWDSVCLQLDIPARPCVEMEVLLQQVSFLRMGRLGIHSCTSCAVCTTLPHKHLKLTI